MVHRKASYSCYVDLHYNMVQGKFHGTFFLLTSHCVSETLCFRGDALAGVFNSSTKFFSDILPLTKESILGTG